MRFRIRAALVVLVGVLGAPGVLPISRLHAQVTHLTVLDSIGAMGLDSVTGSATAYFRHADRERALELHSMLERYLAFWNGRLDLDARVRVAVLDPEDWKRLSPLPYGFPNNLGPPANLILAAAAPQPGDGLDTLLVDDGRDWLVIGHEGGHLITLAMLPPALLDSINVPPDRMSPALRERYRNLESTPPWVTEYAANVFATGFVDAREPAVSTTWKNYLRALTGIAAPRFTHLDDWFGELMRATAPDGSPYFLSAAGGPNFGWYQGAVGLTGAHVLEQGWSVAASHIRRLMSGDGSPTTSEIVQQMESLAPGTMALLDSLGVSYRRRTDAPAAPQPGAAVAPVSDSVVLSRTAEIMERRNIMGVTSGQLTGKWATAIPGRILPGWQFTMGDLSPDSLRTLLRNGTTRVFAEVTIAYQGITPGDPLLEPYLAVAEELGAPVGIHLGAIYRGAPYLPGQEKFRAAGQNPLLLEDALIRHPRLRLYVMHAGWPYLDDMIALMATHPQVYVDIGILGWGIPRAEFHHYLRRLIEAGFEEDHVRIGYGVVPGNDRSIDRGGGRGHVPVRGAAASGVLRQCREIPASQW